MRQTYLLDTHVPIQMGVAYETLPARIRALLQNPENQLLLSVVSDVEVAVKHALRKLDISRSELAAVCANAQIESYPLRQRHTDRLFTLPMHHRDPFDRMIIATALADNLPVISRDRVFRKYSDLRVIAA